MMETLKPIRDREVYSDIMSKKLEFELYSQIYQPILKIFGLTLRQVAPDRKKLRERLNDKPGLVQAILAGRVSFLNGYFKGVFSAAVSKDIRDMGGVFDRKQKAWKVDPAKVPVVVSLAIAQVHERNGEKVEQAIAVLKKVEKDGVVAFGIDTVSEAIFADLEKQFLGTTSEKLEIPMAIEGYVAEKLKRKYTENMELAIKGWTDEAIVRLRDKIQENSMEGYRAERMELVIRSEYGVSMNKARFLARQETSLIVSKYREENYTEAGVMEYKWSTSQDRRVRQDHRDLNGRIFRWDSPPVVDVVKGRRGHPGEDFGCRCVAIPVLPKRGGK